MNVRRGCTTYRKRILGQAKREPDIGYVHWEIVGRHYIAKMYIDAFMLRQLMLVHVWGKKHNVCVK